MSTIYFCEAMYLFLSMFWLCICSFVSVTSAFGHSLPVHEEEDEYEWPKELQLPPGSLNVSWGSLVLVTLVQCHVDRFIPQVSWGWCNNWFIVSIALFFVSPFHPFLFLPLLPVDYHAAWMLFSQWKGRFWLFWYSFSEWLSVYVSSQALFD